jgi:hypothetical protein
MPNTQSNSSRLSRNRIFAVKAIVLITATLGLGILAFLGYFYFAFSSPNNLSTTKECQTAMQSNVTASEHASKKVYTDPSNTFQVAYPSNWVVQVNTSTGNTLGTAPTDPALLPNGQPSERTTLVIYDKSYPEECSSDSEEPPTIDLETYIAEPYDTYSLLMENDPAEAGYTDISGFHPTERVNKDGSFNYNVEVVSGQKQVDRVQPAMTTDIATVTKGNIVLLFNFEAVEKQSWTADYNFSSYTPIVNEIENSTTFLK